MQSCHAYTYLFCLTFSSEHLALLLRCSAKVHLADSIFSDRELLQRSVYDDMSHQVGTDLHATYRWQLCNDSAIALYLIRLLPEETGSHLKMACANTSLLKAPTGVH